MGCHGGKARQRFVCTPGGHAVVWLLILVYGSQTGSSGTSAAALQLLSAETSLPRVNVTPLQACAA